MKNIYFLLFPLVWNEVCSCRDKGPKSYVGPWALSEDVEWFEERHIFSRCSNLKSHEQETGGRWSEKKLLFGYDECNSSKYYSN